MLNSVSFAGRNVYDQANIDSPQAHSRQAATAPQMAPTDSPRGNHNTAKAVIGTLVAAAAIVTGLAVGNKKGTFNPEKVKDFVGKHDWAKKIESPLTSINKAFNDAGQKINDGIAWVEKQMPDSVKNFFKKTEKEGKAATEKAPAGEAPAAAEGEAAAATAEAPKGEAPEAKA